MLNMANGQISKLFTPNVDLNLGMDGPEGGQLEKSVPQFTKVPNVED